MKKDNETEEITRVVARIHAGILAFIFAIIGGVSLFIITVWLIVKGGQSVGLHLQLLGQYFIGYSVSWKGSIVGLLYGAIIGGLVGWTIGTVYNRIVGLRQR